MKVNKIQNKINTNKPPKKNNSKRNTLLSFILAFVLSSVLFLVVSHFATPKKQTVFSNSPSTTGKTSNTSDKASNTSDNELTLDLIRNVIEKILTKIKPSRNQDESKWNILMNIIRGRHTIIFEEVNRIVRLVTAFVFDVETQQKLLKENLSILHQTMKGVNMLQDVSGHATFDVLMECCGTNTNYIPSDELLSLRYWFQTMFLSELIKGVGVFIGVFETRLQRIFRDLSNNSLMEGIAKNFASLLEQINNSLFMLVRKNVSIDSRTTIHMDFVLRDVGWVETLCFLFQKLMFLALITKDEHSGEVILQQDLIQQLHEIKQDQYRDSIQIDDFVDRLNSTIKQCQNIFITLESDDLLIFRGMQRNIDIECLISIGKLQDISRKTP